MHDDSTSYRSLRDDEIRLLTEQGCHSHNWSAVQVADPFDPHRMRNVVLQGHLRIGANAGSTTDASGREKPAGIENAHVIDCELGSDVRITNVAVHLAGYRIGDRACLEQIGLMETRPGAHFGNGVEVEVLNEGGGREVTLFNDLDAQFAYALCLYRYRSRLAAKLQAIARTAAERVRSDRGTVGQGARIRSVTRIVDVNVGEWACIDGTTSLVNGTVLSSADQPTRIGSDVDATDFIVAEGARVDGAAVISRCYVGQACQVGKQFSAEGSLFFANCEAFHGEACSVFAGPYSVTHHKSTLLIAGLFSFYNAGSGTNQSNHMYKLGPVHEGKLERGCKTGSFSYIMWPCRIGPFSVVLGKHTRTFDTSDFPFSHLQATEDGRCDMMPGLYLMTVGTIRDGAKWPTRDRRAAAHRRDRISFDVLSPFTVGRMIRATTRLGELASTTDRAVENVKLEGTEVKRVLLRTAQKYYRAGIEMYLLDKVLARVERQVLQGGRSLADAIATSPEAVHDPQWVDVGGQLLPRRRLQQLCEAVEDERITDKSGWDAGFDEAARAYDADEWAWVKSAYRQVTDIDLDTVDHEHFTTVADSLLSVRGKFLRMVENDAQKEFEEVTRTGFGIDGDPDDVARDFAAVRGTCDDNSFIRQLQQARADLERRVADFKQVLAERANRPA